MSRKIDIKLEKSITINTGNYSSIKPSVSITLHDVPVDENLEKEYKKLSDMAMAMLAMETISLGNEISSINDIGLKTYIYELEKQEENISCEILNYGKENS